MQLWKRMLLPPAAERAREPRMGKGMHMSLGQDVLTPALQLVSPMLVSAANLTLQPVLAHLLKSLGSTTPSIDIGSSRLAVQDFDIAKGPAWSATTQHIHAVKA